MNLETKEKITNVSARIVNQFVLDRTVVIAAYDADRLVDHCTGMLLRVADEIVVITAAHMIKRFRPDQLQIIATSELSNIKCRPKFLQVNGGDHRSLVDVGYLTLSKNTAALLEANSFLTLDQLEVYPAEIESDLVLLFGMPSNDQVGPRHVCYKSFSFLTSTAIGQTSQQVVLPDVLFSIDYPEQVFDSISNRLQRVPDPHGMSGGGVWRAKFKDTLVWSSEDIRLIGILTEFHSGPRLIKANRIEPLLRLLARGFPEAENFLKASSSSRTKCLSLYKNRTKCQNKVSVPL